VKNLLLIVAPIVASLAFGCVAIQAQNAAPAGDAANGKKLWVKENCYSCHGYDGHGGAGVKLAPKPIAQAAFIGIVRHPPKSAMPTFSAKVIPDSDLRDMWAYLSSVPATPAVKDVPLLSALQ
jgi:mono/diheme cytochrome c family protein